MGRDRKNESQTEHFTKMTRRTMQTEAWRALSPTAQALYPWIKLEWHGPKHNNNGSIRLSLRQAAERIGCNPKTAGRAFQDLQAKGFLVQTEGASLGVEGQGKSPSYEITELPRSHLSARRLFDDWRSGRDFEFKNAPTNNPAGHNGRTSSTGEIVRFKRPER